MCAWDMIDRSDRLMRLLASTSLWVLHLPEMLAKKQELAPRFCGRSSRTPCDCEMVSTLKNPHLKMKDNPIETLKSGERLWRAGKAGINMPTRLLKVCKKLEKEESVQSVCFPLEYWGRSMKEIEKPLHKTMRQQSHPGSWFIWNMTRMPRLRDNVSKPSTYAHTKLNKQFSTSCENLYM